MWPSRPAGAAPAEFRLGRRRSRSGRGRRGPLARLGADGRRNLGGGNRWRAAHRQPGVVAAAAVQCPARAAQWGGGARRRASTSAREGDGCFSWGKPPVGLGARRGGLPWRWWAVRLAEGRPAVSLSSRSGSGSVASK
jgi:hypothetical protein